MSENWIEINLIFENQNLMINHCLETFVFVSSTILKAFTEMSVNNCSILKSVFDLKNQLFLGTGNGQFCDAIFSKTDKNDWPFPWELAVSAGNQLAVSPGTGHSAGNKGFPGIWPSGAWFPSGMASSRLKRPAERSERSERSGAGRFRRELAIPDGNLAERGHIPGNPVPQPNGVPGETDYNC